MKEEFEVKHTAFPRKSVAPASVIDTNDGCTNCRTHAYAATDLMECGMNKVWCPRMMYFGDMRFCAHPSAKQFASSNQP